MIDDKTVNELHELVKSSKAEIIKEWSEIYSDKNGGGTTETGFKKRTASKMFDYFLNVIRPQSAKKKRVPASKKIVEYVQKCGIGTKEVFKICTELKDTIVKFILTDKRAIEIWKEDDEFLNKNFWEASRILNERFLDMFSEYVNDIYKKNVDLNRYSKLIEDNVIMSMTDAAGRITYVSDAFCELTRFSRDELMGKPHNIIRHPDTPEEVFKDMWEVIKSGKTWRGKIKNLKKNKDTFIAQTVIMPVTDEEGNIEKYISIRHDITDKIKAYKDPLTKIFNRRKFEEEFEALFIKAHSEKSDLSLIMFDVDDFKKINDKYGHSEGDEVLIKIASCVKKLIRKSDIFARWGGEEFVILMPESPLKVAVKKAEKARAKIEKLNFKKIDGATCSFGVAKLKKRETKAEFMDRVDRLLYKAKKEGKNRVEYGR